MAAGRVPDKKYNIFNFGCWLCASKNISQVRWPPRMAPHFSPNNISDLVVMLNFKLLVRFTYPSICICADQLIFTFDIFFLLFLCLPDLILYIVFRFLRTILNHIIFLEISNRWVRDRYRLFDMFIIPALTISELPWPTLAIRIWPIPSPLFLLHGQYLFWTCSSVFSTTCYQGFWHYGRCTWILSLRNWVLLL